MRGWQSFSIFFLTRVCRGGKYIFRTKSVGQIPTLFCSRIFLLGPAQRMNQEVPWLLWPNGNQKDQGQLIFLFRGTRKRSPAVQRINLGKENLCCFLSPHCLQSSFCCANCEETRRHKARPGVNNILAKGSGEEV